MANFLQKFRDRMARTSRRFVGIDFDSRRVHIVYAHRGAKGPEFLRFHTVDVPAEVQVADPLSFGPFLHKSLRKLHLASHPVVMNVPRSQAVLKPLTLPAGTVAAEVASMVRFQVDKELPFRSEDAVIDYTLAGGHFGTEHSATTEGMHVLVAAVRLPSVAYYRQLAQTSGLQLLRLGLRPNADARCVLACHQDRSDDSVAFVHVNFDEIEIDVLTGDTLAFTRSVSVKGPSVAVATANAPLPLAGSDPKAAADNLSAALATLTSGPNSGVGVSPASEARGVGVSPASEARGAGVSPASEEEPELTSLIINAGETPVRHEGGTPSPRLAATAAVEIARSLQSFQALQRTGRIGTILIAGDTGIEQTLVDDLAKRLNVRCELFTPSPALDKKHAKTNGAFAATIGLAIGQAAERFTFDFLNPKQSLAPRDARKIRVAAAVIAAAVLLVGLLWANASYLDGKTQQLAAAATEEKKQKDIADRLAMVAEQTRNIEGWAQTRQDWLAHWAFLSDLLPDAKSAYIQNLTITSYSGESGSDKKGGNKGDAPVATIKFTLRARDREIITALTDRLVRAQYQFAPSNVDPCRDDYGYVNETHVSLTVPMDMNSLKAPSLGLRSMRPSDDASAETFGRKNLPTANRTAEAQRTPEHPATQPTTSEAPKADYREVKFDDLKRGSQMLTSMSATPIVLAGRMKKDEDPKYLVPSVSGDSHVCFRMEEPGRPNGARRFVYCYVAKGSKLLNDIEGRGPQGLRFAKVEGRAYFTGQEPADCPVAILVENLR